VSASLAQLAQDVRDAQREYDAACEREDELNAALYKAKCAVGEAKSKLRVARYSLFHAAAPDATRSLD
jgi:hypothetical protein